MRNLYFVLLLHLICLTETWASVPLSSSENVTSVWNTSYIEKSEKHGLLQRVTENRLLKYLKKHTPKSGDSKGKKSAILGLIFGVTGVFFFISLLNLIWIPLGLAGLVLSIIGLIKGWNNTWTIKGLAIAGIVLNTFLCVGTVALLVLFSW